MEMREGTDCTSLDSRARVDAEESEEDFKKVKSRQDDLMASLKEIEKLDAILKMKITEEKRAKLSRIQIEEESRDLLRKLSFSRMPDRIKINLEQFKKLLNEVVKTDPDTSPCVELNEVDITEEDERTNNEEEKEIKESSQQQATNNLTFVERNIRLAKCGRGTLSLTDEEKLRVENLLTDIEELESKKIAKVSTDCQVLQTDSKNAEEIYGIDVETKSVLMEIDQRLQVLGNLKTVEKYQNDSVALDNSDAEKNVFEENVEQSRDKGRKKEKKKVNRLEEINKLLASMNLVSNEEISPLSQEEIEGLVRRSKQSLSEEKGVVSGGDCIAAKPPQEVITELVSGAKLLMPKFKYRFDDS